MEEKVAFIGAGNMTSALIDGLIDSGTCSAGQLLASDPRPEALELLRTRHEIATDADNRVTVARAEIVVLATKPQTLPSLLPELAPLLGGKLVLSVAAGVPTRAIESRLPCDARVVRAMPNTPALVRAGATALCRGSRANEQDLFVAERIFSSVGVAVNVDEALMDLVTGLSGSGPAYVFAMIEALAAAGERLGLPASAAGTLAAQTVYGAAKLLMEGDEPPHVLRARVTSPNGTTEAGLKRLGERGFAQAIDAAVERATERASELGREVG